MPLIILSSILLLLLTIQVIFYILPAFALHKNDDEKTNDDLLPVSVIIACRNELQNLKSNLQFIINQQYPQFEIIIADDNSTDGTSDYIAELAKTFPNIKLVENKESGKKSALSNGIRAASYEHLVFTDADCRPATEHWIAGIMSHGALDSRNNVAVRCRKSACLRLRRTVGQDIRCAFLVVRRHANCLAISWFCLAGTRLYGRGTQHCIFAKTLGHRRRFRLAFRHCIRRRRPFCKGCGKTYPSNHMRFVGSKDNFSSKGNFCKTSAAEITARFNISEI